MKLLASWGGWGAMCAAPLLLFTGCTAKGSRSCGIEWTQASVGFYDRVEPQEEPSDYTMDMTAGPLDIINRWVALGETKEANRHAERMAEINAAGTVSDVAPP